MPEIGLVSVSRRFGTKAVLDGVNAVFPRERLTTVVGPSGSGKTTLARVLAGLDDGYLGDITFDGVSVRHLPPGQRGVSFLFQQPPVLAQRSVEENIALPLRVAHLERPRIEKLIEGVCSDLAIAHLRRRAVGSLSGGERQRVALARCLVRDTPIAILDEPLKSSIEPELQGHIRRLLRRDQIERKRTVIVISHDPADVFELADSVASISATGSIDVQDSADVVRHPATVALADALGLYHTVQVDATNQTLKIGSIPVTIESKTALTLPSGAQFRLRHDKVRVVSGTAASVRRALPISASEILIELQPLSNHADPLGPSTVTLRVQPPIPTEGQVALLVDPRDLTVFDSLGKPLVV